MINDLELTGRQQLLEGLEEFITPLLLLLDLLLPKLRLCVLLCDIHVEVHAFVFEPPNDEVVELRTLDEGRQVYVYLVEPINALPLSLQALDQHFVCVIGLLYHAVQALLPDPVIDFLLSLEYFDGVLDEGEHLGLAVLELDGLFNKLLKDKLRNVALAAVRLIEIDLLLVEQNASTYLQDVVDSLDLPPEQADIVDFIEQYLQILLQYLIREGQPCLVCL